MDKKKRTNCINKAQNGSKKTKLYPLRSKWINRITEIRIQNVISDGYKIFATAKSFLGNVEILGISLAQLSSSVYPN